MHRYILSDFLTMATALALNVGTSRGQSLDGVWEITAVIDNGRVVEPTAPIYEPDRVDSTVAMCDRAGIGVQVQR
jgi:hypothetical protein